MTRPPKTFKAHLRSFIDDGIFGPAYWLAAFAFTMVLAYVVRFGFDLKYPPADDPAAWGQFGDFFGGIVNPACAYMAFLWLARSYALQKTELAETRRALEESREAQQEQARLALLSARTQSLSIRLTAVGSQLSALRAAHARAVESANSKGFEYAVVADDGTYVNVKTTICDLHNSIQIAQKAEDRVIAELNKIDAESVPRPLKQD